MQLQDKIKELNAPLDIDNLDFRVQSVTSYTSKNNGLVVTANILVYKDARIDMSRLDSVVGPLNWKREHTRDNRNCKVSIYNDTIGEWVSKEDTGTESNTEAEKGLASDSFKRACTNWGIGRELYDYPKISIILKPEEYKDHPRQKGKYTTTGYFNLNNYTWIKTEDDKINVIALDENGEERYNSSLRFQPNPNKKSNSKPKEAPKNNLKVLPIEQADKVGNWAKQNGKDIEYLKTCYSIDARTEEELTKIINS